jgi:selenoprotein W-related protein
MIPSQGGCFEVTVGGTTVYSKLLTGEFPDEDRVLDAIGTALGM